MKMSKQSYNDLKGMIKDKTLDVPISEHRAYLIKEGKAKDIEKRLAWDYGNGCQGGTSFICHLYKAETLNDSHIETALLKIIKEIEAENVD